MKNISKEVKDYSGRLRININKNDGLNPGDNVVLILESDYQKLQAEKETLSSKVEMLEHERTNLEELVNITLNPIHEHYKSELEKKDNIIKAKDDELNNMLSRSILPFSATTSISGLSFIDLVRGKHKNVINDFHDRIWVNVPMDQVQEVEKLPKNEY